MDESLTKDTFPQFNKNSSKRPFKLIVTVVLVIALASLIVFGVSKFQGLQNGNKKEVSLSPTPTEFVFPTDTPSPTIKPTGEEGESETLTPTVNPVDKSTGLNRSNLSVEVKNGSGEVGLASKGSEVLKSFGYHVVGVSNADSFSYENTVIEIKKDKESYLKLLKKDLSSTYTIGSTSANISSDSSVDAIIILGKQ